MRTFLDSGVLIAAFRGESDAAEKAFQILEDPNREFISNDFVKLELIPKAKYHRNGDEVEFYNKYFSSVSELFITTPDHMTDSFNMACNYGLQGGDAVITCAAIKMKADVFVTSEGRTKPMFRIPQSELLVETIQPEASRKSRSWYRRIFDCLRKM